MAEMEKRMEEFACCYCASGKGKGEVTGHPIAGKSHHLGSLVKQWRFLGFLPHSPYGGSSSQHFHVHWSWCLSIVPRGTRGQREHSLSRDRIPIAYSLHVGRVVFSLESKGYVQEIVTEVIGNSVGMIVVHGQHGVCSLCPPKSQFAPYLLDQCLLGVRANLKSSYLETS